MKKILSILLGLVLITSAFAERKENEIVDYNSGIRVGTVDPTLYTNLNKQLQPQSIYTNGIYIAITNVNAITFTNTIDRTDYAMYGRIFISTTNQGPMDVSANLSFYNSSNRVSDNVRWRTTNYQVRLYLQLNTNTLSTGSTNILVADPSGFAINNLLFLCGNNEYTRISNISGTSLILESPLLYEHAISNCVAKVSEYQTRIFNIDGNTNVCGQLRFSTNVTVNIVSNVVEVF
jgi:hypothetical protein